MHNNCSIDEESKLGSDLFICLAEGHFELLLEFSIFCLQFFDATIFGKDHQITARICFPC